MKETKILVIGGGQLGAALTIALREKYGCFNVIAAGKDENADILLDVLDHEELNQVVRECSITQIYLLADGKGKEAWKLNVGGLLCVLRTAKEQKLDKVFWPSSVAVFGPGSPKYNCPQQTRIEPDTVYGISKRTGEYWCNYYFEKYGVDVRSIRVPVLEYAIDVFHHALAKLPYTCFLSEDNCLPMLYLPDAVRAIFELMDAPKEKISIRTSYNVAGMSFAPCDLVAAIKKHLPEFEISYAPDHRNIIANNWPASIKDEQARRDWGWAPAYDLKSMCAAMLEGAPLRESEPVLQEFPDFVN